MGSFYTCGLQGLIDNQLLGGNTSSPVYLRIRNYSPDTESLAASPAAQMGFSLSASDGGTVDELIQCPPASVQFVSMYNIGNSGGKLRFGARKFTISQTFVSAMMAKYSIPVVKPIYGLDLFEGNQTVGLVTDGVLFSIEGINHEGVASQPFLWFITANANETK